MKAKTSSFPAEPLRVPEAPQTLRNFAPARRHRVIQDIGGPSLTRQEFKDDCDVNKILARFQRTGALNHFAKYSPAYGDFTACDFQTAQNLILRARKMFDDLPANIKREVSTPEGFLEFVNNPANAERMAELGLRERKPSEAAKASAADLPKADPPPPKA